MEKLGVTKNLTGNTGKPYILRRLARLDRDTGSDYIDVEPLATAAEAGAMGGRGKKGADNICSFGGNKAVDNVKSFGGNDATYLVRRLKRDHPDIAAQLARGARRSH